MHNEARAWALARAAVVNLSISDPTYREKLNALSEAEDMLSRSALVDVPAVESEPVDEQWRYRRIGADSWSDWQRYSPTLHSYSDYLKESRPLYASPVRSALAPAPAGEDVVEEGAKLLAAWIRHSWDGLGERDISNDYPDFTRIPHFHGGKPALRKIAASVLARSRKPSDAQTVGDGSTSSATGTTPTDGGENGA